MPPNTTSSIESVSEKFQKLNLKQLAREQGSYQVFPKTSVRFPNNTLHVEMSLMTFFFCIVSRSRTFRAP